MSIQASRRFGFRFAALPDFVVADLESGRIDRTDLHVLVELIREARDALVHLTDEELSRLVRISKSRLKESLQRLRDLGRIRSVRGLIRGYRRALQIVWLAPRDIEPTPLNSPSETCAEATGVASEGPPAWPLEEPPLEPPIRKGEEDVKEDDDVNARSSATAEESPSSSIKGSDSQPRRKATKAEVERVTERAQRLFPSAGWLKGRIRSEARKCSRYGGGLSWVDRALECAEKAQARTWGYVATTLKNWREEGGPPPPPPTAEEANAAYEAAQEERYKRINALLFGPQPEAQQ